MNKVSLVITVLNEQNTILLLLKSISSQVLLPDEVIIVDGGSNDSTVELINNFAKNHLNLHINVYSKKGNRSVGRNYAILKAKHDWIAITDAGCVLDRNWLKELVKKRDKLRRRNKRDKKQKTWGVEVIAGYYKALAKTPFEHAVAPYVLVMPDKVNEDNFLPATRSVLLSKRIWKAVGGFNEKLSESEDYEFARRIKSYIASQSSESVIVFAKSAVAYWIPRSTLKSFIIMIFKFARSDIYAGIIRPKVLLIFVRYLLGLLLLILGVMLGISSNNFWILFGLIPVVLLLYILWSIYKNYRYVSHYWYWLPILQISSDLAVMWGSVVGFLLVGRF